MLKRTFLAVILSLGFAGPAFAMPDAVITTTQTAARTYRFSSTPCQFGFCSYTWQAYKGRTTIRFAQLGTDNPQSYTFPVGDYSITVTVGGLCTPKRGSCPAYGSTFISVR